jgi:predicted phage-related endonuclease
MTTTLTTYSAEDYPQRSPQWLELRRGIVTASIVGTLVTPATVKVASNDDSRRLVDLLAVERINGYNDDPSYQNLDMWRGEIEEPRAREKYAEHHGVAVDEVGFMIRKGDGWTLGCSPDGLVGLDGGIEVKCPRAKTHLRTILDDEVPSGYMAQIQAALLVSGRQWWDYISWSGGMPMYQKRVLPDGKWHDAIREAVIACESAIAVTRAKYEAAVDGLPMTERLELVVI